MLKRFAISLVCVVFAFLFTFASPASAQVVSPEDFTSEVVHTTFDQMPPFTEGGEIGAPDDGTIAELGYDPSRVWQAGERPSDVIQLGDIDTGLGVEMFTLEQIAAEAGFSLDDISINNLEFLAGLTVDEFLNDVPFLGDWPLAELDTIFRDFGVPNIFGATGTINETLKTLPELADLSALEVFGELPVTAIPNLSMAQLLDFEGIGNAVISDVPGLGNIPLGAFPNPLTVLNAFGKQDIAFGPKEYSGTKPTPDPVSGGTNGTKTWQPIACSGGCAHIELTQEGWKGAQWMSKDHRVKDGYGLLGSLFGEAGAYRLPFGNTFALQVTDTDEKTGTAEWGIAFRVCAKGLFFDLGCTAYFLEVPLGIETKETDIILTGLRDGKGGATQPMEAPPGWEGLRPATPPELSGVVAANKPSSGGGSLCGDGPGGINYGALSEAYGAIEGNYNSVGSWVDLGGREKGYGLGKYQYMSYREDVRVAILQQPGGQELLNTADSGRQPTAAQIDRSFPADEQDLLFRQDQEALINKATASGYKGDRLLEVLGQIHFYGPALIEHGVVDSTSISDRHGRLSLKDYGEEFRDNYKKGLEGSKNKCQSTGKYISPIPSGYTVTSRYGPRTHPVTGEKGKFHSGIDLAAPTGTPVVAADGGKVIYAGVAGGYGLLVEVQHSDGTISWYGHLNSIDVNVGDSVAQGAQIGGVGSTGVSTGPHVDFGFRNASGP
ncbi:MAG: M23 family metallopeptidase [Cyanobacteria bacterium P01_D01_bin.36]